MVSALWSRSWSRSREFVRGLEGVVSFHITGRSSSRPSRRSLPYREVYGDISRTSALQGQLTVFTVTVCHTAGQYGEK